MKKLEYLVDRKDQQIQNLQDELRELRAECKSGAWFMFFAGNVLGFVIGGLFV